jgi:hypothetical protein
MAGELIKAALEARGRTLWSIDPIIERAGELCGLAAEVGLRRKQGNLQFAVFVRGDLGYGRNEWFILTEDTDALGLIRRFEGLIKGIPKLISEKADELEKARADLPRLERLIASPGFVRQQQLDETRARMLQLEKALQPSRQNGGETMRSDPRNEEWQRLDEASRTVLRGVIAEARARQQHVREPFGSGEVYAYCQGEDGISWGINGGETGFNIARGVIAGRELELEIGRAKASGVVVLPNIARGESGADMAHPNDRLDHQDGVIFELGRKRATGAGEMPPRSEVIADALEAGLVAMNGASLDLQKEQIMNLNRQDLTAAAARLEPHEFLHLQSLTAAEKDETAFDLAFNRLRDDPRLSGEGLAKLAEAYAGTGTDYADRQTALGAIETRFYAGRRAQSQTRQAGGRSAS